MEQFDLFLAENENVISVSQSKNYNALVFAYVGDSVFSLFVRNFFATKSTSKAGVLNAQTNKVVRASAQSKILDGLMHLLTEEELAIVRSARNIKTNNVAKNSNLEDYKKATSFEAVIGYLYMTNQVPRLKELLKKSLEIELN